MTIRIAGKEAHLEGDWTLSGAADNIDSLALSLQQIESGSEKSFRIDCGQVGKVDPDGLQLLDVWMECARMRGVEPSLVNVNDRLLKTMQRLNFRQYLSDNFPGSNLVAG